MSDTLNLSDAPIDPGQAIADNPDLPLQFINDTLKAVQEANAGQLTPYTFGSVACDTVLTSKGQTTIPKEMRAKNKSILALAGMLYEEGRTPLPVEQLSF